MKLFTIGFSKKGARKFFNILEKAKVKTVIDTRLNHNSQINGFAKSDDLNFFLERFGIGYKIVEDFTPTEDILKSYREKKITWDEYEKRFVRLLEDRKQKIEKILTSLDIDYACLLCSEDKPHKCHRRLVAEFIKENFIKDLEIIHL